jgi:hypothetical protein
MRDDLRNSSIDPDGDDAPFDLSSFGPPIPAARFDALVANITRAGAPELQRRRSAGGLVRVVVAWRRPLITASGLAAAAGIAVMLRTSPVTATTARVVSNTTVATDTLTVSTALGIPADLASSVEGTATTEPK